MKTPIFIYLFLLASFQTLLAQQYSTGLRLPTAEKERHLVQGLKSFHDNMLGSPPKPQAVGNANARRFDLREKGYVTPIKSQQTCGSCWAFSAMASYESSFAIVNNQKIDVAEQHIINCSGAGSCSGGWPHEVFAWLVGYGKQIESEQNLPYRNSNGNCSRNQTNTNYKAVDWDYVSKSRDWQVIPTVEELKQAIVEHGAISVCVYVDTTKNSPFYSYKGGVFRQYDSYNSPQINHAVNLVGWDDDKGAWLMRNSWGIGWGENGYMWIAYKNNKIGQFASWVNAAPTNDNPQPDPNPDFEPAEISVNIYDELGENQVQEVAYITIGRQTKTINLWNYQENITKSFSFDQEGTYTYSITCHTVHTRIHHNNCTCTQKITRYGTGYITIRQGQTYELQLNGESNQVELHIKN